MSLFVAIAALALGALEDSGGQEPAAPQTRPVPSAVGQLEDIVVEGTLESRVRAFVDEIVAPPKGRFLARWHDRLCPGVVNLDREAAQAVADRIGDLAASLDIDVGRPGCDPNVVVIFTTEAAGLATAMVERDRRIFDHPQLGAFNRGDVALEHFMTSDAPVRWWHLSMPVDPLTGLRTVRLGEDLQPRQPVAAEGRLGVSTVDVLYKAIIIVDVDRLGGADFSQVADYIAMVTLAQIEPEADIAGQPTILNVFRQPDVAPGLTEWDRSYLDSLYASISRRRNPGSRTSEVVNLMVRDQRQDPEPAEQP
ncbi:hypothetical protein GCM10007859_09740 [Brevundimonas denitrificans]|uniref:DUF2927 domain-containing protein n=1 Tax=Brevundimonas denitrificans TaxID=1443434 RepID=A0ABQ6BHQ9_9CAUL|nr:hypothetical protein [Brevundimonas denitrificans]GLS00964.1 hypothetical protein GCM10007859_09740 [Brevundimonas denitrificans]